MYLLQARQLLRWMQLLHFQAVTKPGAEKLIDLYRYGFWVRTRQAPYRVVTWEAPPKEDGRQTFRGRHWVEVLPQGEDREPETFFTADVEYEGPTVWLDYYPATNSRICGWGQPRNGEMQYCPRLRDGGEAFCRKHMAELIEEERKPHGEDEPGAEGEPVPASE